MLENGHKKNDLISGKNKTSFDSSLLTEGHGKQVDCLQKSPEEFTSNNSNVLWTGDGEVLQRLQ